MNEAQPTQGYKQYQQHGQYYYNNQYGQQASNENIGQHNHNYKEEERNESENEEGDEYFKRLKWEDWCTLDNRVIIIYYKSQYWLIKLKRKIISK